MLFSIPLTQPRPLKSPQHIMFALNISLMNGWMNNWFTKVRGLVTGGDLGVSDPGLLPPNAQSF